MMQDVFSKLRSLQDILSQKYEIEKEINEIPKTLTTKTELLNRLKVQYIDKNERFEDTRNKISRLRHKLEDAEIQRENYEKQMDNIKTQREYEALEKEIKDATEKEQQLRKEILRQEKILDELRATLEREEDMIGQQEKELEDEQSRVENESVQKKEKLKELADSEKVIVPGLDEEIVFKFERIIKSKAGLGIVPIREAVCTGCHMKLPQQFVNEVHGGEKILFCPYCSRILFYSEEKEEESDAFFMDQEVGSLADLAEEYEEE